MGLSNQQNKRTYLTISCGKIVKGKKPNQETFDTINGVLEGVSYYWDKGSVEHKVKAHDVIQFLLKDGDDVYILNGSLSNNGEATTCGWMLASYLDAVSKGEHIQITVWPGDNEKVTCACIRQNTGENWKLVERTEFPTDQEERLKKSKEIIADHDAWYKVERKGDPETDPETGATRILAESETKAWTLLGRIGLPPYTVDQEFYHGFFSDFFKRKISNIAEIDQTDWALLLVWLEPREANRDKLPHRIKSYLANQGEYDPFKDEEK